MKKNLLTLAIAILGTGALCQAQNVKTYLKGSESSSNLSGGPTVANAQLGAVPTGLAQDTKRKIIYVAASGGFMGGSFILSIDTNSTKQVYVRAGNSAAMGFTDAGSTQAYLDVLGNIAIDKNMVLFIADKGNHAIRKLSPYVNLTQAQRITTVAGGGTGLANNTTGSSGSKDGTGVNATFNDPQWIAIDDKKGEIIVVDRGNDLIRAIDTATKVSSTIAGKLSADASKDGDLKSATFEDPAVCWVNPLNSDIWVFENNGKIRKIDRTNNKVTTEGTLDQTNIKLGDIRGVVREGTTFILTYGCKIVNWDPSKPTTTKLLIGGVLNGDGTADSCGAEVNGNQMSKIVFNEPGQMLLIGGITKATSRLLIADQMNYSIRSVQSNGILSGIKTYSVSLNKEAIKVFPNPANDFVNIQFKKYGIERNIEIFNLEGRKVMQSIYSMDTQVKLDIQGLTPGMYLIRSTSEEGIQSKSFIIE